MNLEQWVKIFAILTGVASLVTVAITLQQIHHDYRRAEIKDWQKTAIFSIVSHAKVTGISEKEIQEKYNALARDAYKELPREELQTAALERALLEVISMHAIQQLTDGSFAFAAGPPVTSDMQCRQVSGDFIMQLVVHSPGTYTFDELHQHLKTEHLCEFTDADFGGLIGQMTIMGVLIQDAGKFSPGRIGIQANSTARRSKSR
jgi:hypothetical protein